MDKQTTIAFILIGALLVVWLYINSPSPDEIQNKQTTDTTLVAKDTAAPKIEENKPAAKPADTLSVKEDREADNYGKYFTPAEGSGEIITLENDLVKMEFSTKGADIRKYYLKDFRNWYSADVDSNSSFYKTHVQLINYTKGGSYDLSFVTADGKAINTANLMFTDNLDKSYYKVSGNDSLVIDFKLKVDKDSYILKRYIFYGNKYSMQSDIEMVGMNNLISNNTYDLLWSNGIRFVEENSVDEANYSNASLYYGGDHVIVDASSVGEKEQKDFNGRVDWIAVRDKYFAAIIAPNNPASVEGAYIEGTRKNYKNDGVKEFYSIRLIVPFKNQDVEKNSFTLYVGPVDYDILKTYGDHFIAIVEFGSFLGLKFIVRPIAEYILMPLFTFLHTFIPNYGWVIIVFSLIIKFVLYPLTKSSYQSMKKMQMLQPKMAEIKEKYKDDPQKVNKETMKLYSTYGVNPAGGCLPLLLQMPIFVALWGLFQVAIELRQQPFMLWITDLSRPDIIYHLPFKIPLFGINQISGLALLMGITTFVQQKMSVKDPKQQGLVYIMPVMLTLMFMGFPSGLNLYYFMFNVFSIGQQYYINHKHDGMELQPVKNPKKGKGFMSKLMEAAEQNQKTQQSKKRR